MGNWVKKVDKYHTHTCTRTCTYARMRGRTHAHAHTHTQLTQVGCQVHQQREGVFRATRKQLHKGKCTLSLLVPFPVPRLESGNETMSTYIQHACPPGECVYQVAMRLCGQCAPQRPLLPTATLPAALCDSLKI